MNKIFISIACFMDNDIVNTIEDCLDKAKYPNNIVFGICLQSEDDDKCLDKYKDNKQFKIKHMNWSEARGPAYARSIIYDMFSDEDYFFQIDCHTRFYQDWDEKIIKCFNDCKKINDKIIISHYPVNINDMGKKDHIIVNISTVRCIDINMGIKTHGRHVDISSCPMKSWGISAAMLFFDKKAYHDIPFDKDIYFGLQFEEQVVLAARYWTSGYDIFTPDTHIIATEYITNRKRQKRRLPRIPNLQKETYDRLCHIMKLKCICKYDGSVNSKLGNERTIEDYYKMLNIYDKVKNTYPDNWLDDTNKYSIDLPMFYINLDRRPLRRERMEREIKKHNLNITRFSAIDGMAMERKNKFLSKGEYGCWSSAYTLWEKVCDSGKTTILFQDDIIFNENFSNELNKILDEAKILDYDIILLAHNWYNRQQKKPVTDNISTIGLFYGLQSYIITPKCAKYLCERFKDSSKWPKPDDVTIGELSVAKDIKVFTSTKKLVTLHELARVSDTNRGR